jgi:hypothetical protein
MDDQLLTEQKQAGEPSSLEDPALAVLAGDLHPDLERSPPAIRSFPQRVRQHELLPRVKLEVGHRRELGRLLPGGGNELRNVKKPGLLSPEQAARRACGQCQ